MQRNSKKLVIKHTNNLRQENERTFIYIICIPAITDDTG